MPITEVKAKIEGKAIHKNQRKVDENIFKIAPIEAVYYKDTISVNFQSKRDVYSCDNSQQNCNSKSYIETADKERTQELSITPRFNFDSKYYTSCFIIPYEGEESDEEMKRYHKNKATESEREIESLNILVPKPKSKNLYCAVCRSHYEDYLSHIGLSDHKKNIRKSKFNSDIEYLTILIKERMKNCQKDGVLTRLAKKKLEIQSEYFGPELKSNKKKKVQAPIYLKPNSRNNQERDDLCEAQTPFNKKWHYETTAKSIYSALD